MPTVIPDTVGIFIEVKKMLSCTFFGHADAPEDIEPILKTVLITLIKNFNVDTFYLGHNGNFDKIVQKVLWDLGNEYRIKSYIVLAYLPKKQINYKLETLYPEKIELVPKQFAISYRNKWMIEKSDYVITFVTHTFGGAYKAKMQAEKKGKNIINLTI